MLTIPPGGAAAAGKEIGFEGVAMEGREMHEARMQAPPGALRRFVCHIVYGGRGWSERYALRAGDEGQEEIAETEGVK